VYHMLVDGKAEIVGFDIELGKLIAAELGVEIDVRDMSFDGLLMDLERGVFDIVLAGVTYKPERYGLFSIPYDTGGHVVLIRSEDKDKYTSAQSLDGYYVGAQLGTTSSDLMVEMSDGIKHMILPNFADLIISIQEKKIEAIVCDLAVAEGYVAGNADLYIADFDLEGAKDYMCAVVQVGNNELIDIVNKIIEKGLADGSFKRMLEEAIDNSIYEIQE